MAALALLALVVSATLSLKPSALGPRRTGVGSVVRSVGTALRTSTISEAVEIVLDDADIERPAVDRRRYRLVRLANGVEALLVSDGDADEAGAALSVKAGSFDDTRLGLAHFHEHMLFLGTRKYPDEDEYEAYLNAHGGGSNAWTADEETCYYLNVNAGALDGALDRLAQFFVDPLLSLDCVEREVKAVDSEYAMALQDDGWRMLSVLKATANGAHPFSRFSTGSLDTLNGERGLHDELKRWNAEHYVGDKMRLAVVGRESLDELEQLVAGDGRFGAIPSSGTGSKKAPRVTPWAAESEEVPRVVKVVPVRDWRSLQLLWPLPARSTLHERGATPELFVSHLLGHEGEESLHALLRDRGWVDALSCGTAAKFDDAQLFELSVDLTELGEAHVDDVLDLIWAWVGTVRSAPVEELKTLSDELQLLHGARFRFAEKRSAADTASDLADALWDHPTQPLSGPSLAGTFDEEAVRVVLDALTPENAVVFDARKHETNDGWTREPWHGATYRSDRTGDDVLARWARASDAGDSRLALPKPNRYVAEDLSLVDDPDDRAGVYRLPGTGRATVWRRADLADAPPTVPKVPKVMVAALFREAEKHTARSLAATKAIGNTVFALMNHEAYDASLAGLSFSVDASRAGFVLRSSGFSDKAKDALELAASKLRELVAKSDFTDAERKLFESEKEELGRRCSDSTRDEPSSLVTTWSRYAMDGDADALDVDALGAALADDSLTMEVAAAIARERLRDGSLEIYVAGNADDAGARAYADAALTAVADPGEPTEPLAPHPALRLPRGDFGVAVELRALREGEASGTRFRGEPNDKAAEPSDPNNAVEMYWQLGRSGDDDDAVDAGWPSAAKRDAAATLLGRLAQASAFNRLRTVEQLGYIASAGLDSSGGVIGFTCLLQSATGKSPPELEERVEAWLAVFAQELRDLSDADLALKREGLATEILQRPASLRDVVSRDWHEISSGRRKFSHVATRAKQLRDVSREDLVRVLEAHVLPGAPQRRLFRSRVYSPDLAADAPADAAPAGGVVLRSLDELRAFKRGRDLWPPAKVWDEGAGPEAPAH